ncbi:DUF1697 domain-containing protein [Haliangium sp.]|uniref:DUF1697 domain-containing protein n=1 Tax=Haliangium sp. TaxID=2663208 RepID=UPI003D111581
MTPKKSKPSRPVESAPASARPNRRSRRSTDGPVGLIALLRGINVGGHKKVPMAELRALATDLGFADVATYIQSGNLVFSTDLAPESAESALEAAIADHFGFSADVVVRTGAQWRRYASGSPFPDAERERPKLLHLGLPKRAAAPTAAETLLRYAAPNERIEVEADALWIDFASGAARSKLSPAVLNRALGSPVTMRNWRTVHKLVELLDALERP